MEIDTKQATEIGILILFVLFFTIILSAFYPSDFSIFDSEILIEPIKFDAVTLGIWAITITSAVAVGFLTSGSALSGAIIGIIFGFLAVLYPIFLYIIDVMTLGMFNYPSYTIHQEMPIILLLIIAIPSAIFMFYLAFDLVTSALHSAVGGD